jgi:hypothetical protein
VRSTNQLINFEQDISKKLYQANRSIDHLLMISEQGQKITKENLSPELDKENTEYNMENPLINVDTSIQSDIESF